MPQARGLSGSARRLPGAAADADGGLPVGCHRRPEPMRGDSRLGLMPRLRIATSDNG